MSVDEIVARTTVSIDPRVMRLAKTRMRALGIRKFSQYVALLLEKDQRERGPIVVVRDEEPRYRIQDRKKLLISTEALIITDALGRTMKINRAFSQMCGYSFKELRGEKPGAMLQGPATEKDIVRDFRKAIKAVNPFACTLTNYDKTGVLYHVRIEMRPLFDGTKHIGFEARERRLD